MKSSHPFSRSLHHALRGIRLAFLSERSFRLQTIAAIFVIIAMLAFPLRLQERILLLLLIGSILVLELINSVFERLVDAFKPRIHPLVKDMKDLMAAAVLVASCIAAIVGTLIFFPHIVG